jgi:hypothetical protein
MGIFSRKEKTAGNSNFYIENDMKNNSHGGRRAFPNQFKTKYLREEQADPLQEIDDVVLEM